MHPNRLVGILACVLFAAHLAQPAVSSAGCRDGVFALPDARDIAAIKGAIDRACPCASFAGSTPALNHLAWARCARDVINDASDGSPRRGAYSVRPARRR